MKHLSFIETFIKEFISNKENQQTDAEKFSNSVSPDVVELDYFHGQFIDFLKKS